MKPKTRRRWAFVGGFVLYFSLLWTLWDTAFIYPLKIFVVLLHEVSHAIAIWATGGVVDHIVLDPRQGGATLGRGGSAFLALSAGYLGSLLWGTALVLLQFGMALALRGQPWWVWMPCAYIVGATADHAIWALIHETSHNLVFRGRTANRVMAIIFNLPLVAPAAISFCRYHILHHRHMGEMDWEIGRAHV